MWRRKSHADLTEILRRRVVATGNLIDLLAGDIARQEAEWTWRTLDQLQRSR